MILHREKTHMSTDIRTIVLEVSGVQWASSKAVVESTLRRQPGVVSVEANPVSQTANVSYDPGTTSQALLRSWIIDCGYHCAGQSVPNHICDPAHDPYAMPHGGAADYDEHSGDEDHGTPPRSAQDVMGHGGGRASMSMASMIRSMRNRFLVALILSIPITLLSPIGREVIGFAVRAPFGVRDDVFALILSLPVIFYSAWIFFDGAFRALRARTLDMMVLVAVGVGAGWLYSLIVTLTGGGEVFYEASTVLATFVLLGHWVEMRARGGICQVK